MQDTGFVTTKDWLNASKNLNVKPYTEAVVGTVAEDENGISEEEFFGALTRASAPISLPSEKEKKQTSG